MQEYEVEVLTGDGECDMSKVPARFGVTQVTVGPDGCSDPGIPLVFAPVHLRTSEDELLLQTGEWHPDGDDGSQSWHYETHRILYAPKLEFDWTGELRISGMEERKDGVLLRALWAVRPFLPDEPLCGVCGHYATWHVLDGATACTSTWPDACECAAFTGPVVGESL